MFQFPRFASTTLTCGCQAFSLTGCPIRKSADHRSFAPTRGLSQLITSFIASVSQGIRHAPLSVFFRRRHATEKAARRVAHTFSCRNDSNGTKESTGGSLVYLLTVLLVSTCQRSIASPKRNGTVENNGFEPLTPCLQSRCSSQLS